MDERSVQNIIKPINGLNSSNNYVKSYKTHWYRFVILDISQHTFNLFQLASSRKREREIRNLLKSFKDKYFTKGNIMNEQWEASSG